MDARTPSKFGSVARRLQADFRATLSQEAQRPADDKAIQNPHLIAIGHEIENLYREIREADSPSTIAGRTPY